MKGDKGSSSPLFALFYALCLFCGAFSYRIFCSEIVGTLLGFDDFVNMVLEDVIELCGCPCVVVVVRYADCVVDLSEAAADGSYTQTKIDQILLNGNNVCLLIPGGEGPVAAK